MRGQEETSTNQVGRNNGSCRESPTVSSLVSSMSMEELRSFYRVLDCIILELLDVPARSIVGQADKVVYFTLEQFGIGIRFLVASLVKQFLHVTRAPPLLIHPNGFLILMGCSMLKFLYQLDILLAEICFVYTLNLGTGGRLFMLAHSPRLQFVIGLPDSPKTEVKEVVLIRGLWYETLGYLGLPFDVN